MSPPRKRKKKEDAYAFIELQVTGFDVDVSVGLNSGLGEARPLYPRGNEFAYDFSTSLAISAECLYPPERKGDNYAITIFGKEHYANEFAMTLNDFHARDAHGALKYRTYRGRELPVYERPHGLAVSSRRRGTRIWDVWIPTAPRVASDMLTTLAGTDAVYVAIHERKIERTWWVQSLSLQTHDPSEE